MRAARDPLKSVAVPAPGAHRGIPEHPDWEAEQPVWEMEGVTRYASPRRIRLVAYGARLERGLG